MKSIQKIGFIGSGNMATKLSQALVKSGIEIPFIISRSIKSAGLLAGKVMAVAADNFEILQNADIDLLIIAISDQNIKSVGKALSNYDVPMVHTSGATTKEVLAQTNANYGVFYPLQTLTSNSEVDFNSIPICIDGNEGDFVHQLEELAKKISQKVYKISDEKRKGLHLAAVMLNNNVNHLLAKVEDVLLEMDLPREILNPLLIETIRKAQLEHPKLVQTGPAKRSDLITKSTHLELLKTLEDEQLSKIYNVFWESIESYYK